MENYRDKYSIKKLSMNQKGASLFAAILISLFALLTLAGLYFALTKLISTSHTIKTYTSIKDAATGGVNHAVMLIQSKSVGENEYCNNPLTIRFRLSETSGVFENKVYICQIAYVPPPGYELLGVAYSREIPGERGNIYSIISEALGPQDSRSRIEAVYAR